MYFTIAKHNQLPVDLQMIFELGFKSKEFDQWTKSQFESAKVFKELKDEGGLEFVRMNAEQFANLRKQMYQIEQDDIQKYGGLTKEMYESYYEFWEVWYPYKELGKWWGSGLQPEEMIGK